MIASVDIHLFKHSTGQPHPAAAKPVLHFENIYYLPGHCSIMLEISGDTLCFLLNNYFPFVNADPVTLVVYNWKTGEPKAVSTGRTSSCAHREDDQNNHGMPGPEALVFGSDNVQLVRSTVVRHRRTPYHSNQCARDLPVRRRVSCISSTRRHILRHRNQCKLSPSDTCSEDDMHSTAAPSPSWCTCLTHDMSMRAQSTRTHLVCDTC